MDPGKLVEALTIITDLIGIAKRVGEHPADKDEDEWKKKVKEDVWSRMMFGQSYGHEVFPRIRSR